MSKRSGGKNRVCLPCRIKYPGQFTHDPTSANMTQVCSECAAELTLIPDSIRVPKKTNVKAWNALSNEAAAGTFAMPLCPSNEKKRFYRECPEHEALDCKLADKARRTQLREEFQKISSTYPGLADLVQERYMRFDEYDFCFDNIANEICSLRQDIPGEKAASLVRDIVSLSGMIKPTLKNNKNR